MAKLAIADHLIPAPDHLDYGPRPEVTRGFVVHMAEGLGVAAYLSRDPLRGVSVHFTVEQAWEGTIRGQHVQFQDGDIVQMLNMDRISGSLNPDTIRTDDDPYFGARHASAALGDRWPGSCNETVISVETAGEAKTGPTPAQVASLVRLFAWLRAHHYPRLVPLGHRDFQNVKRCPGTTFQIKQAFRGMGGHGLDFTPDGAPKPKPEEAMLVSTRSYRPREMVDVKVDALLHDIPDGPSIGNIDPPLVRRSLGLSPDGKYRLIDVDLSGAAVYTPDRTAWVLTSDTSNARIVATVGDAGAVDAARKAGFEAGLKAAAKAITEVPR